MGNVCSSSQKKKGGGGADGDNVSERSEDSPSYQLADKKDSKNVKNEAPLADPEQISDLSTGHNLQSSSSPTNGNINKGSVQSKVQSNISDSVSSTPLTTNPPCDIPTVSTLPPNLITFQGKPIKSRRTEKDRKIIIYILSANSEHQNEKIILQSIYTSLRERCSNRGFELIISDPHDDIQQQQQQQPNDDNNILDLNIQKWTKMPLESQAGHEEVVNCLAEITRHSNFSYIIPVLFLGTSLGTPLLPLTIENQDFTNSLNNIKENSNKLLLEKWYTLDNSAQPSCYRLNANKIYDDNNLNNLNELNIELSNLLLILIEIFSKELRDSYLTTIVEQEINNTVLINQELSKRCIWIQTGLQPPKINDNPTILETEMNRRLINIQNDLKNQLSEKNLIRLPPSIHVQDDQLASIMESLMITIIDGIVDEHTNKFSIPNCTFGADKRLLSEIETVSQYSKVLGQNCANFSIMGNIKSYISGISSNPLIIYGETGSGKSVLTAKIMHNVHTIIPETNLILRYANLTELSSHNLSLVSSIAEQLSVITKNEPCRVNHSLDEYNDFIKTTLESSKLHIVIVIDSLDEINDLRTIDWLPIKLPTNVKVIFTTTTTTIDDDLNWLIHELRQNKKLSTDNFVELTRFSDEQWNNVLSYGGGDFYAANGGALQLPKKWRNSNEKTPLQAKILWWLAWLGNGDLDDTSLDQIILKIFETIESKIDKEIIEFLISAIVASDNGVLESDLMQLLEESKLVKDSSRIWFKFCWLMGPMLLHNNQITLMDKKIRLSASERYSKQITEAHTILYKHYTKQNSIFSDKRGKYKCYNVQKFIKLPYHAFMIDNQQQFLYSIYLTDLQWIHDKLIATGCVQLLTDIHLAEQYCNNQRINIEKQLHLNLLKKFFEKYMRELNYDGDQFYALFNSYIAISIKNDSNLSQNDIIQKWIEFLNNVKSTYLERLKDINNMNDDESTNDIEKTTTTNSSIQYFDSIINLNDKGNFVVSISTDREELCVWDVTKCKRVRILNGVPQPTSLCPVGDYGVAVLCRREIKVIDLNEGVFKVTLKGVMNQKMPYFGLHDSKHLVCLSRNRMYVNLMNLESGDCITTFKAGEDRFLNSLLVSGDGRILVCGDETQKPFPLLVWHLSQRKLLYDLRIPHHDFITSLSAITYEGSYVCVVAKELNEPTPNFIVVYDLQSGTLFKKWKPSCNTVSLAISQTIACVIAGLEDSRILIWDLVTGNCRCTLQGHNAPVTLLKLDPQGKILLSGDKEGRDMSIRMWELESGKALAVYTPPAKISTCEILPNGKFITLALENYPDLITLILRNHHVDNDSLSTTEDIIYGEAQNEGKTFDLK